MHVVERVHNAVEVGEHRVQGAGVAVAGGMAAEEGGAPSKAMDWGQPVALLGGKHVVFGRVSDGMLALRKIENAPTGPNNRPKLAVKIVGARSLSSTILVRRT